MSSRVEVIARWMLEHPNIIPPMDHPLSRHWHQPSASAIEIDNTHALMSRKTLEALPEYSCSQPTGVYEGKMWRRRRVYVADCDEWLLCWYGLSDKPDCVSNHVRKILIVE